MIRILIGDHSRKAAACTVYPHSIQRRHASHPVRLTALKLLPLGSLITGERHPHDVR